MPAIKWIATLSCPYPSAPPPLPLNWSSNDCCNWEGIACDPRGYVTHISLPSKGLTGNIFPFLGNFTHLSYLNLSHNLLSSTLPRGLFSSFNQLTVLDLSSNYLAGDFSFNSSANRTSEGLPTSIQVLDISSNYFNGMIQSSFLERARNLTKLNLSNNNFTGSLPQSLMKCTNLVELILRKNLFEGNITSLNFSGLQQLTVLDMGINDFTDDSIAHSDGFKNVQLLSIDGCYLTGQLPTWLSNLKKLEILVLSNNSITGSIPNWFSTLPRLKHLDLGINHFSGEIPKELCSLPALISAQALESNTNSLILPIFADNNRAIENQYNSLLFVFRGIWLNNNSLSGKISFEIGHLKLLHVLDLSDNNFSGNIPNQMSKLTNLQILNFSTNQLSGEIPVSLANLNFLAEFSVANNNLSGPIPSGTQLQSFSPSAYEGMLDFVVPHFPRSAHIL
ncbi:Tyrosine-sulfated glycopeptide receptor 1 [Morella rubra]|uniref:Tyrosine-sulfated glycopeptide receptor 1 n=1 Tax=Morella rubra TaxID=262757 RepID=A0A6A1WVY4_9ROSI|nr:Tyrosine-sulfated glycopeptide receptor 1 [Morella rubra]